MTKKSIRDAILDTYILTIMKLKKDFSSKTWA
jgi:hypothetical protein